jgi:hypothetical protein
MAVVERNAIIKATPTLVVRKLLKKKHTTESNFIPG